MEITEIRKFLNDREEKERALIKGKKENLFYKFNKLIFELADKYNSIKKVYIYGSILNDNFNILSDLDVYIEEISAKEFWEIYRILNKSIDIEIDLYTQNDDPFLIKTIKNDGKIIYER